MSGIKNQTEAPEPLSVRDAGRALLARIDVNTAHWNPADRWDDQTLAAIVGLREALAAERTAELPVDRPELVLEGIEIVKASRDGLTPDHVRAIVQAAVVAIEAQQSFALRWDADMRAIRRWQAGEPSEAVKMLIERAGRLCDATAGHEGSVGPRADMLAALQDLHGDATPAGARDLTWPDHADLVVWLLELIELRPACPSIDAVESLIGELDQESRQFHLSAINPNEDQRLPAIRSDPYARAAHMLRDLANALIAASQRLVVAESMGRFAQASIVAMGGGELVPDAPLPGEVQCRVCGCTESTACIVPKEGGGIRPCGWAAPELCDNPDCIKIERARLEAKVNDYLATAPKEAQFDIFGVVGEIAPGWEFTFDQNLANAQGGVPKVSLIRFAPDDPI